MQMAKRTTLRNETELRNRSCAVCTYIQHNDFSAVAMTGNALTQLVLH